MVAAAPRPRPRWLLGARCIGVAVLVGVTAGVTAACGTGAYSATANTGVAGASGPDPAGTISETGSGLLFPLLENTWAPAYHQQFPDVTVTPHSTGSGTGIALATEGKVDIGASDAYLSSGDLVKNPTMLNIPLAISAQTIIYNLPALSANVNLNGEVLAGIYNGSITMWNDPKIVVLNKNLHLPALKIVPIHRSDSSGDTFIFTSYLSTQYQQWNDAVGYGTKVTWPTVPGEKAAKSSFETMNDCKSTPGCITYNGISYWNQEKDKLGEAALENAVGQFTLPTPTAIAHSAASFVSITPPNETISLIDGPATDGYPIVNYEYAIVSTQQPDAGKASRIRAFLNWVITTGNSPTYLNSVGFQPLPGTLVSLGEDQIAEIGS